MNLPMQMRPRASARGADVSYYFAFHYLLTFHDGDFGTMGIKGGVTALMLNLNVVTEAATPRIGAVDKLCYNKDVLYRCFLRRQD